MSLERTEGRCFTCTETKPVRYIDLYVIGSEGLYVCHSCEMEMGDFVRGRMNHFARASKEKWVAAHPQQAGEERAKQAREWLAAYGIPEAKIN